MEQEDVKKTAVSPPKSGELEAIAHFADKAVDKVFAKYYKVKDIRGSVDIAAENVDDSKEHSYTLYSRLGYLLSQHNCQEISVTINENQYKVKIHAAVEHYRHPEDETVAEELVKGIANAMLAELG